MRKEMRDKDGETVLEYYDVGKLLSVIDIKDEALLLDLQKLPKHAVRDKYRSVCFIGTTGSGKSASCNSVIGDRAKVRFKESASTSSVTYQTKGILAHWLGDASQSQIFVIDTPGLGDSHGRDTQHIAEMITALQTVEYMHSFVICFNSRQCRFDEQLKAMVRIFQSMFGETFFANVVVCFTQFGFSKRDRLQRKDQNEEYFIREYTEHFSKAFGICLSEDQFVFFENQYMTDDQELKQIFTEDEVALFIAQLHKLRERTQKSEPFSCLDIKAVLSKYDQLATALEKEKKRIEEQKAQFADKIRELEEQTKHERELLQQQIEIEKEEKRKAIAQKEEEMKRAKEAFEQRQREAEQQIEANKQQFAKLQAESQEKEVKWLKEQQQREVQARELAEKEAALRRQANDTTIELLKKHANDKDSQLAVIRKQQSDERASYEKQIRELQKSLFDTHIQNERNALSREYDAKEREKKVRDSYDALNQKLQTLRKTCIYCLSENPRGTCSDRRHQPTLRNARWPSGVLPIHIVGITKGDCSICGKNGGQLMTHNRGETNVGSEPVAADLCRFFEEFGCTHKSWNSL